MRRFIPIIIVLAAIGAFEWFQHSRQPEAPQEQPSDVALLETDAGTEPALPPEPLQVTHGKISSGRPFFIEMQRAGLHAVEIQELVDASKDIYSFRRVQPGQKFAVFADAQGNLDSLHFSIDNERILKVTRGGEAFDCRLDTLAYRVEHHVTSGTVASSILRTLHEKGANPELATHLAVIYQWDIDFFKDIREGDTFTILYEKKIYEGGRETLGAVLSARVFSQGNEHYAFRYLRADGSTSFYDERGNSLQKSLLRAPLKYSRVSSNFSYRRRHPVHGGYAPHLGIDYAAPTGTPVRSTGDGTVLAATTRRGNGKYVKIKHNSRYQTYYLHLSRFAKGVRQGARVRQGQVIGYVGSTGSATASHLDYRIKVGEKFVNPRTVKLPAKEPVPRSELALYNVARDACLVRLFETTVGDETLLVRKPAPPMQSRMTMPF